MPKKGSDPGAGDEPGRAAFEEEAQAEVPLPPPLPGGDEDVMFFLRKPGRARSQGDDGGREWEDIMLRRVQAATAQRFRRAAGGRGLTHAEYLAALVALHDAMRGLADRERDERVASELERLGLGTISL